MTAIQSPGVTRCEATRLDLAESQLALAALASLPTDVDGARAMLERIAERPDVQLRSGSPPAWLRQQPDFSCWTGNRFLRLSSRNRT